MKNLLLKKCQGSTLLKELKTKGFVVFNKLYPEDYCKKAIDFIDSNRNSSAEKNYSNTEVRLWDCESKSDLLKEFYDDSISTYNHIFNSNKKGRTLLAISNSPISPNDDGNRSGRWHIDSFTNQWKVFLFLVDTNENSGPFEFIPGTHHWHFRLRHIMRYLKPNDFLFNDGSRSYQKLSDQWVENICQRLPSKPIVCSSGTVLIVSTNAIHRARPCFSGSRYALTTYL